MEVTIVSKLKDFIASTVEHLVYINHHTYTALKKEGLYWAIQAGLLTPLTFARHRLSPLAAFTSGAYFLHNGRW